MGFAFSPDGAIAELHESNIVASGNQPGLQIMIELPQPVRI
jgi:hypothetical protein